MYHYISRKLMFPWQPYFDKNEFFQVWNYLFWLLLSHMFDLSLKCTLLEDWCSWIDLYVTFFPLVLTPSNLSMLWVLFNYAFFFYYADIICILWIMLFVDFFITRKFNMPPYYAILFYVVFNVRFSQFLQCTLSCIIQSSFHWRPTVLSWWIIHTFTQREDNLWTTAS